MIWHISLAFYLIFIVVQSLWQRAYAKKLQIPETYPPTLSYLLVLTPLSVIVGLFMNHNVEWSSWLVFLLIIEGVFIALFNWLMFSALRRLAVAKFEVIFQLYAIVIIVLGWVLLGEKLNQIQIIGGIILFIAAYLAIQAPKDSTTELHKRSDRTAIIITIGAATALGIGLVTEKAALQYMDVGAYFIFGFLSQTIALVVLASKDTSKKVLRSIKSSDIKQSMVMGLLSALVGFSYIITLRLADNISLVTILSTFSLPMTVLAGYLFLHERENMPRLWTATILGCIGLIIVTL